MVDAFHAEILTDINWMDEAVMNREIHGMTSRAVHGFNTTQSEKQFKKTTVNIRLPFFDDGYTLSRQTHYTSLGLVSTAVRFQYLLHCNFLHYGCPLTNGVSLFGYSSVQNGIRKI